INQAPVVLTRTNYYTRVDSILHMQVCNQDMAAGEHADLLALKSRLGERSALWKEEMERCESQVDALQVKYMEV
ncbi:Alpha-amylase, partial [Bienertia sinuspersici]